MPRQLDESTRRCKTYFRTGITVKNWSGCDYKEPFLSLLSVNIHQKASTSNCYLFCANQFIKGYKSPASVTLQKKNRSRSQPHASKSPPDPGQF